MSSVASTIERAFTTATSTAKVADLQRDIVDPTSGPVHGLTTDHGVKVSNTDDWCVFMLSRRNHIINRLARLKVIDGRAGPSLLEDQISREKIHRFDHERYPIYISLDNHC
jgi:catalase